MRYGGGAMRGRNLERDASDATETRVMRVEMMRVLTGDATMGARAQDLADALSRVDQGGDDARALKASAATLTSRFTMTHESKKVRVLTALCVSDLMRVCAPDAPIEGDDAMRDVYELFLDALGSLKAIEGEDFEAAKSLLVNIANIGLCVPMLDLECDGAETLVRDLFKVLMDSVNAANSTAISEEISKVLATMIEESSDEDTKLSRSRPISR